MLTLETNTFLQSPPRPDPKVTPGPHGHLQNSFALCQAMLAYVIDPRNFDALMVRPLQTWVHVALKT